jgi:hypothetical protein
MDEVMDDAFFSQIDNYILLAYTQRPGQIYTGAVKEI